MPGESIYPEFQLRPLYLISPGNLATPEAQANFVDRFTGIAASVGPSVAAIQLREKWPKAPLETWIEFSRTIKRVAAPFGIPVIVNRYATLADAAQLDGLHFGHAELSELTPWLNSIPRIPPIAGYSAHAEDRHAEDRHSEDRLEESALNKISYLLLAPIFRPRSKSYLGMTLGIAGIRGAVALTKRPVYALGGIEPEVVAACRAAGAAGIACISAVFAAEDPALAAAELVNAWGKQESPK